MTTIATTNKITTNNKKAQLKIGSWKNNAWSFLTDLKQAYWHKHGMSKTQGCKNATLYIKDYWIPAADNIKEEVLSAFVTRHKSAGDRNVLGIVGYSVTEDPRFLSIINHSKLKKTHTFWLVNDSLTMSECKKYKIPLKYVPVAGFINMAQTATEQELLEIFENLHHLSTKTDIRKVFYTRPELVSFLTSENIDQFKLTPKEVVNLVSRMLSNRKTQEHTKQVLTPGLVELLDSASFVSLLSSKDQLSTRLTYNLNKLKGLVVDEENIDDSSNDAVNYDITGSLECDSEIPSSAGHDQP